MFDITRYAEAAEQIIEAGHLLHEHGWSPATGGNYSARIDEEHLAVTASGRHKGRLRPADILPVDLAGRPVQCALRPSAETLLHCVIYDLYTDVRAVLHTHSVAATVLTRALRDQDELVLQDYELQKAFPGHETHAARLRLPIFENSQDMAALGERTRAYFAEHPDHPGYLIRGHGLYTWGNTMADCLRHVEALEFLMQCELETLRLNR